MQGGMSALKQKVADTFFKSSPALKNKHDNSLRVLMTERPFGMNVQVNVVPRVVEVLPGYPAEKVQVKRGYVLTEVNKMPVDAKNWSRMIQTCKLPCPLT